MKIKLIEIYPIEISLRIIKDPYSISIFFIDLRTQFVNKNGNRSIGLIPCYSYRIRVQRNRNISIESTNGADSLTIH